MMIQTAIVGTFIALAFAQDGQFNVRQEVPAMTLPSDFQEIDTGNPTNMESLREAVSHIDLGKIEETMSRLPPQLQRMMAKAGINEGDVMKAASNMSPQMLEMAASMAGIATPVPFPMPTPEEVIDEVKTIAEQKLSEMGISEDPKILIPKVKKMVNEGLKNMGIDADIETEPEKAAQEIKAKITKQIAESVGVDSEDPEVLREAIQKKFVGNLQNMGIDIATDEGFDTEKLKKEIAKKVFPDVDIENPESVQELKAKLMAQMNEFGVSVDMSHPESMRKALMTKLMGMGIPADNPEKMKDYMKSSMQNMMQTMMMQMTAHKMISAPPMPQMMQGPPMPQMMQGPPMPQMMQGPPMPQMMQGPPMPQMMQGPPMGGRILPRPPMPQQLMMSGTEPTPRFPSADLPPINLEINVNIDPSQFKAPGPQVMETPARAQFRPHPLPPTAMPSYLRGAEETLMAADGEDREVIRHVMSVQSGLSRGAIDEDSLRELLTDLLHYRMMARVLSVKNRMLNAQLESLEAASMPEMTEFAAPRPRMPMLSQLIGAPSMSRRFMPPMEMPMAAGEFIGKIMESMSRNEDSPMPQSPLMACLMGAQE